MTRRLVASLVVVAVWSLLAVITVAAPPFAPLAVAAGGVGAGGLFTAAAVSDARHR